MNLSSEFPHRLTGTLLAGMLVMVTSLPAIAADPDPVLDPPREDEATGGEAFIEQVAERHDRSSEEVRQWINDLESLSFGVDLFGSLFPEDTNVQHTLSPGGHTATVIQRGEENRAFLIQQGNGNQSTIIQDNSGDGSGFSPPGNPDADPPPFSGGETGGNYADVEQSGQDNVSTVLQGVSTDEGSSGFNPPGNPDASPPPFEGDGSGDHVAEVLQDGVENVVSILQGGDGLGFAPPGNPGASPPPFGDDEGGGSEARVTQFGMENEAAIEQFGAQNLGIITQTGLGNLGQIFQSGSHNRSEILQMGVDNEALMAITGSHNDISVQQIGGENLFDLELDGSDNFLDYTQIGTDNTYQRNETGDGVLNETVLQIGDGNTSVQTGQLSGGRSANIIQEGNGLDVNIHHSP